MPEPVVATYLVKVVQRDTEDHRQPLTNQRLEEVITEAIEDELDAHGAINATSERTDK